MSTAPDLYGRGPYTVEDLDALPEEGKRFELIHGWLIPMATSVRHDESAEILKEIIADSPAPCLTGRAPAGARGGVPGAIGLGWAGHTGRVALPTRCCL